MLCGICHEREATIHNTIIHGDAMKKSDFCEQCFEASKPTEARELAAALQAGCKYCGGEPWSGRGNISPLSDASKMSFMCKPCTEEFFRFLREKLPGFGGETITPERIAKFRKADVPGIIREADEHMKKWVAKKKPE